MDAVLWKVTEDRAEARRDYEKYFSNGGVPETFMSIDRQAYFKALYDSILKRDIIRRHRVCKTKLLSDLAFTVMSNCGCLGNLVYLQLRNLRERLNYSIYYLKEDRHEVDFLLEGGGCVKRFIQVSYDISNPKTRERELASLFAVGAIFTCTDLLLITDHENGEEKRGDLTVRLVDFVTWILESPKEKWPAPLGLKGRNGK